MKRLTTLISLLPFFIFMGCIEGKVSDLEPGLLQFEYFEKAGTLHNQFLSNVKNNLTIDEKVGSRSDIINYITEFQNDFLLNCNLSDSSKTLMVNEFERSKYLTDFEVTRGLVMQDQSEIKDGDTLSVFTLLDKAEAYNILDTFELRAMNKLADLSKLGFEGSISPYEFVRALERMKSDWISMGYTSDANVGYLSGYTIAISLASMDWWEDNADAGMLEIKGTNIIVPAWVVADAIGALWGATSGAVGSYIINGEIKWGSVGFGALSGAVAGSTGVVGKVAKWISKAIN